MNRTQQAIAVRLARWLGPWAPSTQYPRDVIRDEVLLPRLGETPNTLRTWVYRPAHRVATGAVLLLPGLHYAGPSDPRLDRFASILASSGMLVYAPFLPALEQLLLHPSVFTDAQVALDALLGTELCRSHKPGVMSISFGSLPALALAANPVYANRIETLVLFGGYASLFDTLRFCVGGNHGRPRDPLNNPVVFLNLIEHIEELPAEHRDAMTRAWLTFVHQTWGRPELKHGLEAQNIAHRIADGLVPSVRSLFLRTTGCTPGAMPVLEAALAKGASQIAWIDPSAYLPNIHTPTHIVHGADDDVISFEQAGLLATNIRPGLVKGVHITGMYGHSGQSTLAFADLGAVGREVRTMMGALGAIALAGGACAETSASIG